MRNTVTVAPMLRLLKYKKSKVHRTKLYFAVLTFAFIVSLVLIICRHSITRSITLQQTSLSNAQFPMQRESVRTVEKERNVKREQQNNVDEKRNNTFSAPGRKLVDTSKDSMEIDNLFIQNKTLSISDTTLQKRNSSLNGNNVSLSFDLEYRRSDPLSKTGWIPEGQKIKSDLEDAKEYDNINTSSIIEDNVSIELNDSSNNTLQGIVNEDWVIALRSRTTNQGILNKRNLHWTIAMAGKYSSHLYKPPAGEIPRQRLPQAIIIGVGHCGTRALINFLTMHPNIVSSNAEVHFYDIDANFAKGYSWYRAQMPLSYSNQITMEKTPCYIWSDRALNEIYKMNKKVKLIVIMKNPVARLVSMQITYKPEIIRAMVPLTDRGVLHSEFDSNVVLHGVYVKYLKPWFLKFSSSQIHVVEGSEFMKDPATEIYKLEKFLQVPHFITEKNFYFNISKGFYCMQPFHSDKVSCLGDGKGRHNPMLDPFLEKRLNEYYRDYNEKLFELLGRRFSWDGPEWIRS